MNQVSPPNLWHVLNSIDNYAEDVCPEAEGLSCSFYHHPLENLAMKTFLTFSEFYILEIKSRHSQVTNFTGVS